MQTRLRFTSDLDDCHIQFFEIQYFGKVNFAFDSEREGSRR